MMMKAALQLCQLGALVGLVNPSPKVVAVSSDHSLHQLGPCTCMVDSKIVDLTPLANTNHTARFRDMDSLYPFTFSWNPCEDFNEGGCRGVAGCQLVRYPVHHFSLGTQSTAKFLLTEEGDIQIRYQAEPQHGIKRRLYVTLMCVTKEEGDKVIVVGESHTERGVYDMTLYSHYSCPKSAHHENAALSIGSILLITLAMLGFVYVVGGVMLQVFVRKEKGVKVLPHVTYWSMLPGLVKDGFLFVKKRGQVDQMYQAVG